MQDGNRKTQYAFKAFRPEQDVERMMERAGKDGHKVSAICNKAIRDYLTKLGFARKKDLTAREAV